MPEVDPARLRDDTLPRTLAEFVERFSDDARGADLQRLDGPYADQHGRLGLAVAEVEPPATVRSEAIRRVLSAPNDSPGARVTFATADDSVAP